MPARNAQQIDSPDSAIGVARRVLGEDFARLQIAYGGQRLYIPTWDRLKKRRRVRLRMTLGDALAEQFCNALGGEAVYIPLLDTRVKHVSLDHVQTRRIKTLIERGYTNNDVSARTGVSMRTVRRWRQRISA